MSDVCVCVYIYIKVKRKCKGVMETREKKKFNGMFSSKRNLVETLAYANRNQCKE